MLFLIENLNKKNNKIVIKYNRIDYYYKWMKCYEPMIYLLITHLN